MLILPAPPPSPDIEELIFFQMFLSCLGVLFPLCVLGGLKNAIFILGN